MDSTAPKAATLEQLVELILDLRKSRQSPCCALLVGAGCSASGGVPLADEFVTIIEECFPQHLPKAGVPLSYLQLMAALPEGIRRELIRRYVKGATVNRAHLSVAQLLKGGFVDRILTTNFDPLIPRACALVGEFPAVYDCAVSTDLEGILFHPKSVFYLHGPWSGLKLHNVEEDLRKQAEVIHPVAADTQKDRMWIIVGYSGRSDPLVDELASAGEFPYGLYWVTYQRDPPDPQVKDKLLTKPNARVIYGFDSDSFFERLATCLGCYPPRFASDKVGWADEILEMCREGDYTQNPSSRQLLRLCLPPPPPPPAPTPPWSD